MAAYKKQGIMHTNHSTTIYTAKFYKNSPTLIQTQQRRLGRHKPPLRNLKCQGCNCIGLTTSIEALNG